MKIKVILSFLLLLVYGGNLHASTHSHVQGPLWGSSLLMLTAGMLPAADDTDGCGKPEPPQELNGMGPGNDHADDNESFFQGAPAAYNLAPDAVIYEKGYWVDALKLLGGLTWDGNNSVEELLRISPFLVFPSGSLVGAENNTQLKLLIAKYLERGGNILVFSQQMGRNLIEFLPPPMKPEGQPDETGIGPAYGWREEQSCQGYSSVIETFHPCLASCTQEQVDVFVDGYLSTSSPDVTVLLRRLSNQEPALLFYPHGKGTVAVSFTFSDWANSHGACSTQERHIIRDLISFLRNPSLPIQMIEVGQDGSTQSVQVTVEVKNTSRFTANKAHITVYDPSREIKFHETEASVNLLPGETGEVSLTFSLPAISNSRLGICHVDYDLMGNDDELLVYRSKSDSGRFALFKNPEPYTSTKELSVWVTSLKEEYGPTEVPRLTVHFRGNNPDRDILLETRYDWTHDTPTPAGTVTVPAGETVEKVIHAPIRYVSSGGIRTFWFHYREQGQTDYKKVRRGVRKVPALTRSRITMDYKYRHARLGRPLSFQIHSKAETNFGAGASTIEVTLEKRGAPLPVWPFFQYESMATVHSAAADLVTGGPYLFDRGYTPETSFGPGVYRLKLHVTRPDEGTETRYSKLYLSRSRLRLEVDDIRDAGGVPAHLAVNGTYLLNAKIKNDDEWDLEGGTLVFSVRSDTGHEAYRKEIHNIQVPFNTSQTFNESFTFLPPAGGYYYVQARYEDKTGTVLVHRGQKLYKTGFLVQTQCDKDVYRFGDTVGFTVDAWGIGDYLLRVSCPQTGYGEERSIQLNASTPNSRHVFHMPYVQMVPSPLLFNVEMLSLAPGCDGAAGVCRLQREVPVPLEPVVCRLDGRLHTLSPNIREPLRLNLDIRGISGFIAPVTGQLRVRSSALALDTLQNITLSPSVSSAEAIDIPLPELLMPGNYTIEALFTLAGGGTFTRTFSFTLPPAECTFSPPPATAAAGQTVTIGVINGGGRDGEFQVETGLTGAYGHTLAGGTRTLSLAAGEGADLLVTVPPAASSGQYTLHVHARQTPGTATFAQTFPLAVAGAEVTLEAETEKAVYYYDEPVTSAARVTAGAVDIDGGALHASVVRTVRENALKTYSPGDFMKVNLVHSAALRGNGLYTISDRGLVRASLDSNEVEVLHDLDTMPLRLLLQTSGGETWGASYTGIHRRDASGQWHHYTSAHGLPGQWVTHLEEVPSENGPRVWAATRGGVSVFDGASGLWQTYTVLHGLPGNYAYRVAVDDEGAAWVSTGDGICRWNGSQFEPGDAPFGDTAVKELFTATADGTLWAALKRGSGDFAVYKRSGGAWEQFLLNDHHSPYRITLWEMCANGADLWLNGISQDQGGENRHRVLCRYDGGWTVYNGLQEPLLEGLDHFAAVPGKGNLNGSEEQTACFIAEAGLLLHRNGSFSHHFIKKDENMLPGQVTCLEKDEQDRLWVGTTHGVSLMDAPGTGFVHRVITSSGRVLGQVYVMAAAPDGTLYVLADAGLIKISGALAEMLPVPENDNDFMYNPGSVTLAVDNLGRPWCGYGSLYTYNGGQWDPVPGLQTLLALEPDREDGMWVYSYNSSHDYQLGHVSSGGLLSGHTPNDSPLLNGAKNQLYLHHDGSVFILGNTTLQSFQPEYGTWIDYSHYDGFPAAGVHAVTADTGGKILLLGTSGDYNNRIYTLETGAFQAGETAFSATTYGAVDLECLDGVMYTYSTGSGGDDGEDPGMEAPQLLALSNAPGPGEQELWTAVFPASVAGGNQLDIPIPTNRTLAAGSYLLKTRLLSSLDQPLASDVSPFTVRNRNLSAALLPGTGLTGFKGVLKKGGTLPLQVELFNDTGGPEPGLTLRLTALSPSGAETVLLDESLSLEPSQRETLSAQFTGTEPGAWDLSAQLLRTGGGGEPGGGSEEPGGEGEQPAAAESSGSLVCRSDLLLQVAEPLVELHHTAPETAGDSPFDIRVTLENTGAVPANLQVGLAPGETVYSPSGNDTIPLRPGERRLLTFRETIDNDTAYRLTAGGDVSIDRQFTVTYGIRESLHLDIPAAAREGAVTLPVSIANTGSLPFTDTLHLDVFIPGNPTPLYSFDRSYTLLPDTPATADTLQFPLAPGNYLVSYHTGRNPGQSGLPLAVQASGIPAITVPSVSFPTGGIEIPIRVANTDTHAGPIGLTIELAHASAPGSVIHGETRRLHLQPGETRVEHLAVSLPTSGSYVLTVSGPRLASPFQTTLHLRPPHQPTARISVGQPSAGTLPVNLHLENNGFLPFNGTLEVRLDNRLFQMPVQAPPGASAAVELPVDLSTVSAGTHTLVAALTGAAGNTVTRTEQTATVLGPDIRMAEVPENLSCDAGGFVQLPLALENPGHHPGEVKLTVTAADVLSREWNLLLQPGELLALEDLVMDAPADLPDGRCPVHYRLSGSGVAGGPRTGSFPVTVNGLSIDVGAHLDRSLYNVGETAQLTLTVEAENPGDPLEAVVNWGDFHQKRVFQPAAGPQTLQFAIPLDKDRRDKIFYGIYHQGGKGLYLNDIYLHFRGTVGVETDKQLYAPGEVIQAVFTAEIPGALTVQGFDETFTLSPSPSASASFQVPEGNPGGTYGISWSFVPSDTSRPPVSGAHRFDVSGLLVKVAEARLDRGKVRPGDGVNAFFRVEANTGAALEMRHWFVAPSGENVYLGSQPLEVNASIQTGVSATYPFIPIEAQAGTYQWVYAIYRDSTPLASGRLAFQCGDLVAMGIMAEEDHYPNGNETVRLWVDYYGEGSGELELLLDGELLESRSVSAGNGGAPGTAREEFLLTPSSLTGGVHIVNSRLTSNALVSVGQIEIDYGVRLPDLAPLLASSGPRELDYTYTIEVVNRGKTASGASSLAFSDNGAARASVSIPALRPGESHEAVFPWSGRGRAGEHVLLFTVDPGNSVREYRENNNAVATALDVPVLFHGLEVEPPSRPANSEAPIKTVLVSNSGSALNLTLHLVVEAETGGAPLLERTLGVTLAGFERRSITDIFPTGAHPPGGYVVRQTAVSDDGSVEQEEFSRLEIETTRALSGRLDIAPDRVPAHTPTPVHLEATVKNSGNVPLENETMDIEVSHRDTGKVKLTDTWTFTLAPGEEVTLEKELLPDLPQGIYDIAVTFEAFESSAELVVLPSIKQEKTLGIHPRVMLTAPGGACRPGAGAAAWAPWLSGAGIDVVTVTRDITPAHLRHRGHANIHVLLGHLPAGPRLKELRARVWNGEGLVLLCKTPLAAPAWKNLLGVEVRRVPRKQRKTSVLFPPSPWGGGGTETETAELAQPHTLRLEPVAPDVSPLAYTAANNHLLMASRPYGRGHILVMAVPPFSAGAPGLPEQLVLNVIRGIASDIYSGSDLTRLLPVEVVLTNQGSEEKRITLQEVLPYGVEAHGFHPEPGETEPLRWEFSIPGGKSRVVSYWAKLPDQVGQFILKSQVSEGETSLGEVELDVEVLQTVTGRLDELLSEAALLIVKGHDARHISSAVRRLEAVRNRNGDGPAEARKNLRDMVEAADALGRIRGTDVSSMRRKAITLMTIMGRRYFEAADY